MAHEFTLVVLDDDGVVIQTENGDNGIGFGARNYIAREIVAELKDAGMIPNAT